MLRKKLFLALFSIALILISAFVFKNKNTQSVNWTFPYFSGAANFERLFDWQISPSDYETAAKLSDQEYRHYKHQKTEDIIPNTVNNYGYVLVALAAQKLFPILGDIEAVILLQLLVHLGACLFLLLNVFQTHLQRYGFVFFYAANPLIIRFVTFPFYYFWMFIPSAALVVLWFKPAWRWWSVLAFTPLLLFSLLIRPTTLFLCALFFVVAWFLVNSKRDRLGVLVAMGLFVSGAVFVIGQGNGGPWHTMYVGVGAYENNLGVPELADNTGYEYFLSQTGVQINTNAVHGNWNNDDVRSEYLNVLKARYYKMVKESPLLFLKNATMNTLQVFSVGYIVNRPLATWASTVVGFLILLFLVYARQFIWIVAVLASAGSFAWYFPPIPAYNFAGYLLLVSAFLLALEKCWPILQDKWFLATLGKSD
jgi:hypothetical protein